MSPEITAYVMRHAYLHWWLREQGKWAFILTGLMLYTGFALRMRLVDKAMWAVMAVGTAWGLWLELRHAVRSARKSAGV